MNTQTHTRTARAAALIAAAHQARETWRAAPAGSLEKKALALKAMNAIYAAQDSAGVLIDYSDAQIDEEVDAIEARAEVGNPIRFNNEALYRDLLKAGRIVMCMQPVLGALDVPGGRYGAQFAISEHVEA